MNNLKKIDWMKLLLDNFIWLIVAVVYLYFLSNVGGKFTTLSNQVNILSHASVLGILVIGQAIVLLTGNFDLSAEGVLSLTTIFAMWLMLEPRTDAGGAQASGWMLHPLIVIPIMLMIGILSGLIIGSLITRLRMNNFIVTLAMQLVLRGIALIISNGQIMTGSPTLFNWLGGERIKGFPVSVIVTLTMYLVVNYLLNQSKFGRELRAVGANRDAAQASGFDPKKIITFAYMISGFMAAFAGWMLLGRLETSISTLGQGMTLETVAASVIGGVSLKGGLGSVGGAFAGVMLLSVIDNGLNLMTVDPFWVQGIRGMIILLALLIEAQKFRYKPKVIHENDDKPSEKVKA
ncbi:MAG: ABC transporter permease [Pelolinea sp.]|nr:ABC transporter permease [Pelolinea sp.]